MCEDEPKKVVVETRHTVFDGVKTYHKKDIADATKVVAANCDCLQGKLKFNTKKKMVNRESKTRKFVPKGTKNSRKEEVIATGASAAAAARSAVGLLESDTESENEPLKPGGSHTATGPINVLSLPPCLSHLGH